MKLQKLIAIIIKRFSILSKKRAKPLIVICNTIKGKGIKFMEDDNNWHYRSPSKEDLNLALKNL